MGYAVLTVLSLLAGYIFGVTTCVLADRQDNYFDSEDYYDKIDKQLSYAKGKKTRKQENG